MKIKFIIFAVIGVFSILANAIADDSKLKRDVESAIQRSANQGGSNVDQYRAGQEKLELNYRVKAMEQDEAYRDSQSSFWKQDRFQQIFFPFVLLCAALWYNGGFRAIRLFFLKRRLEKMSPEERKDFFDKNGDDF